MRSERIHVPSFLGTNHCSLTYSLGRLLSHKLFSLSQDTSLLLETVTCRTPCKQPLNASTTSLHSRRLLNISHACHSFTFTTPPTSLSPCTFTFLTPQLLHFYTPHSHPSYPPSYSIFALRRKTQHLLPLQDQKGNITPIARISLQPLGKTHSL
jgi:hypothetical protein